MKIVSAALLLLMATPLNAEVITYSESTSGDFRHGETFPGLKNIGALGLGINTVNGNVNWSAKADGDIADPFVFEIPVGLALKSATLKFHAKGLTKMTLALTKIDDINALTQHYTEHEKILRVSSESTTLPVFESIMPASSSLYAVYIPASFASSGFIDLSYTWNFELVPAASK